MHYRKAFQIAVLLGVLFALMSCANMPSILPASSDLTPQEIALQKMEAEYIRQFNDTTSMAKMKNLTPEQKEIVIKKKALLGQVRPLISAYGTVVLAGGKPTKEQEQAIYDIFTQLGAKM
jgi:hypothetical protein